MSMFRLCISCLGLLCHIYGFVYHNFDFQSHIHEFWYPNFDFFLSHIYDFLYHDIDFLLNILICLCHYFDFVSHVLTFILYSWLTNGIFFFCRAWFSSYLLSFTGRDGFPYPADAHVGVWTKSSPPILRLLLLPHHAAWVAHAPARQCAPTRTRWQDRSSWESWADEIMEPEPKSDRGPSGLRGDGEVPVR